MATQPAKKAAAKQAAAAPKKRTVLTPQQRIAKLEADLAQAKVKAEEKNTTRANVLLVRRAALVKRMNDIAKRVVPIDKELVDIGAADRLAEVTAIVEDGPPDTDDKV